MNAEAAAVIARLQLTPLPHEGGFFRQTWISSVPLANGRGAGSAIYFLMTPVDFSAVHRLKIDELWHFYAGDPVEHLQLGPEGGQSALTVLGSDVANGQVPQLQVQAQTWQGARPIPNGPRGWSLIGATTCPAWSDADFELGVRADLQRKFSAQSRLIAELTR